MQLVSIHPGPLQGSIQAPPSKSVMQRVLAVLLLRPASLIIHNPGNAADDRVVKEVLLQAGFGFTNPANGSLQVTAPAGIARNKLRQVYFGESGLAARMLMPILALQDGAISLDAAPGLRLRPMHFMDEVLPQLGVRISSTNGHLPATISGPLQPCDITIDASLSSQFLTGLLMAYAAADASGVTITTRNLASKPYIDLTLRIMESLGLPVPQQTGYEEFHFSGKPAMPIPRSITIEGDWSAAAFWLVAGAIAGPLTITGLDAFSTQGDKRILHALMDSGAGLSIESGQIIARPAPLKAFHADATDCPDLFPPLAVLACYAAGTSVIAGVSRLLHKESNRALTIQSEMGRLGADISLQDDLMIIRGGARLRGTAVSAHNDHRIAMMCAIAALGAEGITMIDGTDAVQKSYPGFFYDLQNLGGKLDATG